MLWSSLFALPFGFSEFLFAGTYWSPPTLFDLARRTHLDLESFIFLFAAGGVAAVIYEGATGLRAPVQDPASKRAEWREAYNAALAAPALVFPVALVALRQPICAGIVAMGVGVAARLVCRPDLARKTLVGGALFALLYVALLASLDRLEPGYVDRVWSHAGVLGRRIDGLPGSELLFGASFGAYWSGLREHWRWTFARARPRNLQPAHGRRS